MLVHELITLLKQKDPNKKIELKLYDINVRDLANYGEDWVMNDDDPFVGEIDDTVIISAKGT